MQNSRHDTVSTGDESFWNPVGSLAVLQGGNADSRAALTEVSWGGAMAPQAPPHARARPSGKTGNKQLISKLSAYVRLMRCKNRAG